MAYPRRCGRPPAADDFVIRLCDVRTGEDGTGNLVRTFIGHAARVLAIAPGPPAADAAAPADTLVSVSADRTAMVWDESTGGGLLRKTLAIADDDRTAAFEHAAVRPGPAPHVVTAAGDDRRLWNYHTGDIVWRRDTGGARITARVLAGWHGAHVDGAGAGRVLYCDFGHSGEPFERRDVLQYYLDGIQYALGDLQADDAPRP